MEPFGTCCRSRAERAFAATKEASAEGIAVAVVVVLVIGVVAWQTMPVPARIEADVVRRGMIYGLGFAAVVGAVGSVIALYLIGRAFASFTGW